MNDLYKCIMANVFRSKFGNRIHSIDCTIHYSYTCLMYIHCASRKQFNSIANGVIAIFHSDDGQAHDPSIGGRNESIEP